MTRQRVRLWDEDDDLRREADAERQNAKPRKPNGYDHHGQRRIRLVPFSNMVPDVSGLSLVGGLLGPGQVSLFLGAPGSTKTFLMLDIGLHVATGGDWFGRRVTKGDVVYVAAEAGTRIHNRVFAWRIARQLMLASDQDVPIYTVPMQIDLCNSGSDLDELIEEIRGVGVEPRLIIIDTISRVMAGGNENSPDDMGALIASADRLRDDFGCHVSLVHHVGKDPSRGARGHSSLLAAVDTAINVTRDDNTGVSTAKVVKQRDGEIGEPIHFTLRVVKIDENDETGEEITSCVIEPADDSQVAASVRAGQKPRKAEDIALNALRCAIEEDGTAPPLTAQCPQKRWVREETWRTRCYDDGISTGRERAKQAAFQRAVKALLKDKLVEMQNGYAWLGAHQRTLA